MTVNDEGVRIVTRSGTAGAPHGERARGGSRGGHVVRQPAPEGVRGEGPGRVLRRLPGRARRAARHREARDHGLHRPVRLRQDHAAPLLQPHERPHRVGPRRGHDPVPRRRPVRPGRLGGGGPPADRDGLPEAQPVPEVRLRQRGLRAPPARGQEAPGAGRDRRAVPAGCCALGRGPFQAQELGTRDVRWAAAAAVHRPGHRRGARGDPHGRALLGARPDRHRPHRGPDAGDQGAVHDRHRDPQHAAGGPGQRPHRLLHHRGQH